MNIYQVFTRLFRVDTGANRPHGTLAENGCSKFEHFDDRALEAIRQLGITHLWLTGVIAHASRTPYPGIDQGNPRVVKGQAGSPYAVRDYYDVDPDLAVDVGRRMAEFEALVERCHRHGLGVVVDFVPNHVARGYRSAKRPAGTPDLGQDDDRSALFRPGNDFYYLSEPFAAPTDPASPLPPSCPDYVEDPARATGNDCFAAAPSRFDWYETVKLNYGQDPAAAGTDAPVERNATWERMLEILLFWASKGVDGFRADMAGMVPADFWGWATAEVRRLWPGVFFIAEIYEPARYGAYLGRGGFDYLYDKAHFYDTARAVARGEAPASDLSRCWREQEGTGHRMVRFLENHDEQRLASAPFLGDARLGLAAAIVMLTMHPGPAMIYFGQELGEPAADAEGYSQRDGRTTIFDYWRVERYQRWVAGGRFTTDALTPDERQLRRFYATLLSFRRDSPSLLRGAFYDLMWQNGHLDASRVYAYLRHDGARRMLLVAVNFGRGRAEACRLVVPRHALDWMGVAAGALFRAVSVWPAGSAFAVSAAEAAAQGIRVDIPASGGVVFDVAIG